MDKFWEWMEEKDYGSCECKAINGSFNTYHIDITKQMLIGYMIEYCFEKRIQVDLNLEYCNYKLIYDLLEKVINNYSGKCTTEEVIREMTQKDVEDIINSVQFGEAQVKNPDDWENHVGCPVCKSLNITEGVGRIETGKYNVCQDCGILFEKVRGN